MTQKLARTENTEFYELSCSYQVMQYVQSIHW